MTHLITQPSASGQLAALAQQSPLGQTINDSQLITQMNNCPDWESRYRIIMQLGKQLPPLPTELRTPESEIHGCESDVWLVVAQYKEHYYILADSRARIVKGLIAAVICALQGKSTEAILSFDLPDYFRQLSLEKHLTPSRSNGLASIIETIKNSVQ
ncbi:cysteine desulfuration protein SufE [Sinobacterium caligoides]|uniref:Cysteine desulfuration protein SufE n=1 Tax=Sinobacterium caligoides TaxID=933926 RepID=A0A3N2E045_9GAMM|nr:SufE family protein [Sinobacterium caligoides]ROS05282.1 cysteine desulfuration protein SufE [Sinobacterium caligoides]